MRRIWHGLYAAGLLAGTTGVLACLAFGLAPAVARAEPVCEAGTATFASIGEQQCYEVPAGVNELHVTAVGAKGGEAADGEQREGFGAVVSGDVPVSPGETLYVEVGENGRFVGGVAFGGGGSASRWRQRWRRFGRADLLDGRMLARDQRHAAARRGWRRRSGRNEGRGGSGGAGGLVDGGAGANGNPEGPAGEGGRGGTLTAGGAGGAGAKGTESSGGSGHPGTLGAGGAGGPEWWWGRRRILRRRRRRREWRNTRRKRRQGGGGAGSSFAAQYITGVTVATAKAGEAPEVTIAPTTLEARRQGRKRRQKGLRKKAKKDPKEGKEGPTGKRQGRTDRKGRTRRQGRSRGHGRSGRGRRQAGRHGSRRQGGCDRGRRKQGATASRRQAG